MYDLVVVRAITHMSGGTINHQLPQERVGESNNYQLSYVLVVSDSNTLLVIMRLGGWRIVSYHRVSESNNYQLSNVLGVGDSNKFSCALCIVG